MPASKSGNPDRRGYTTLMNASLVLAGCALLAPLFIHWMAALAMFLTGASLFIALESTSAPPANQARAFQRFIRHNLSSSRRPVLVCLGDDLVHGTRSYSFTVDVPTQLTTALAMPPPKATSIFADPLWVVNCGQNNITTHTVWRERIGKALDCHADYILILVGTNDILAAYKPNSWGKSMQSMNGIPEIPNLQTFARNFNGILNHIQAASPMTQVGVCTLPPMGEDTKSAANKLVRQANEIIERAVQQCASDRYTLIPVFDRMESILEKEGNRRDFSGTAGLLGWTMSLMYNLLPGVIKWSTLGSLVGHRLLHDGIHLNERGGAELTSLIVEWLVKKGVAKAIAVKS